MFERVHGFEGKVFLKSDFKEFFETLFLLNFLKNLTL